MNLIGDPWIPIIFKDGKNTFVSLEDLYNKSDDIRDLSVNPPERIALMRFLICITQAALDGPGDEQEWRDCQNRIIPESLRYLNQRKDKFELYGEKPFMQIKELRPVKEAVIDKLDISLASGNNPTLFDHEANLSGRKILSPRKVINLITFLNFSPSGLIEQAVWGNYKPNRSTFASPCIKWAHTFIRGNNLRETIFFNLLSKKCVSSFPNAEWGKPVWDFFPDGIDKEECFENANSTYLGRLVPLSRFILLGGSEDTRCIIGPTHKSFKISGMPAFREPSTTVISTKKGDHKYLRVLSNKHIWRELGSVLHLSKAMEAGGAPCLNNIQQLSDYFEKNIDIWVGGVEVGKNPAKLHDMVEWNLPIPIGLFGDTPLSIYQKGVDKAEKMEKILKSAITSYCANLSAKEIKAALFQKATLIYWNTLDSCYKLLLDIANKNNKLDEWLKLLFNTMLRTYEDSCPHQTPRQIQAFAIGKRKLFANINKK